MLKEKRDVPAKSAKEIEEKARELIKRLRREIKPVRCSDCGQVIVEIIESPDACLLKKNGKPVCSECNIRDLGYEMEEYQIISPELLAMTGGEKN